MAVSSPEHMKELFSLKKTAMKAYKVSWKVAGTALYILFKLPLFISTDL